MSRKPDDQKPAIALWMRDSRKAVGLTVPQLAKETDYAISTLAKIEGGSNPTPSQDVIGAALKVFRRLAVEKGVVVAEPPGYGERRSSDMTALVAALDRQTEAISRLVSRLDVLASSAIREGVAEALREAEGFPGGGASQGEPPLSRRA